MGRRHVAPWSPALLVLAVCVALNGCGDQDPRRQDPSDVANPASVYCEQQGGRLEIREGDGGGQRGVCVFRDGSECDEWAFYRGECRPGEHGRPPT